MCRCGDAGIQKGAKEVNVTVLKVNSRSEIFPHRPSISNGLGKSLEACLKLKGGSGDVGRGRGYNLDLPAALALAHRALAIAANFAFATAGIFLLPCLVALPPFPFALAHRAR